MGDPADRNYQRQPNRSPSPQPHVLTRLERRLPELYLVFALAITSLLCLLTPPFFAPDEPDQAARAISLSHGQLLAHLGPSRTRDEPGGEIDAGAVLAMDRIDDIRMAWEARAPDFLDRPYGPIRPDQQRPLAAIAWQRRTVFLPFGNTAPYPPALYLPAIAGWRIGEAAGLTIFRSLHLARLLCALTAVALGWLALRLCACSPWLLLPFLLLPSTLFLNGSCSQDSVLLGVAALLAALLSRPLTAARNFTHSELGVTAALLLLCGSARPPYLAMALILFLPTLEARAGTGSNAPAANPLTNPVISPVIRKAKPAAHKQPPRWFAPTIAVTCVLACAGLWRHLTASLPLEHSDEAIPELQAVFLRTHPIASAAAVLNGTLAAASDFARRGVYVIGWNDLLPHHGLAAILLAAIAAIALFAPASPLRGAASRALLLLAIAAPLLAISLAEYIIWTPPGTHTVYGIQPRYWLPMMPLAMMLAVPLVSTMLPLRAPSWLRLPQSARTWILPAATALIAAVACTLPAMAAHAFYRDTVLHVLALNLR